MINFWFKKDYIAHVYNLLGIDRFENYNNDLKQGSLDKDGLLAKLDKEFVLGRERVWIPKDTVQEYQFLKIEKNRNSQYPNGLILTPYSHQDVKYHLKTTPIEERFGGDVIELVGLDSEPFIERAFLTYNNKVKKQTDKDKRLLIYSIKIDDAIKQN